MYIYISYVYIYIQYPPARKSLVKPQSPQSPGHDSWSHWSGAVAPFCGADRESRTEIVYHNIYIDRNYQYVHNIMETINIVILWKLSQYRNYHYVHCTYIDMVS